MHQESEDVPEEELSDIPDDELPYCREDLHAISRIKNLPYGPMIAVLHGITKEYGRGFSRIVAGIYMNEDSDVPLSNTGFRGENPLEVIRETIDDDLGIEIPPEKTAKNSTFIGLVFTANRYKNGDAKKRIQL